MPEIDIETRKYLTVAEVAKYFRLTENGVRTWVRRGQVNCVRIGGRLRFTLEEIERIENAGRKYTVGKTA